MSRGRNRLCARSAALAIPAALLVSGCGSGGNGQGDRSAESLVYSPADRMAAEREVRAGRPTGADVLRPGARCRVHLRRDAAGLAGAAPVSVVGTSRISEQASVSGVVERVDEDAITLRGGGSTYWIPRPVILAVEFSDEGRP